MQTLLDLWPIIVAVIGLVFWLSKSHADIETLKEKVKVLFEMANRK
jgi:hypothetical protein